MEVPINGSKVHSKPMKVHDLAPWSEEAERLRTAPVSVLVSRYGELFGEPPRTRHRVYLLRRVSWRLQAKQWGGLSQRALDRALAIADDRDLRLTAPQPRRSGASQVQATRDPRLPLPGVVLKRQFGGHEVAVKVLVSGFEYQGRKFASLSGVAERITGTRWNGFVFFGLQRRRHAA